MNNATLKYQLPTFTGLMSHGWSGTGFLRDRVEEQLSLNKQVDVEVRSGDYFVTLATTLDKVGRSITDHYVRNDLEDIVSDLLYLQENYTITKNKK